MSARQTQQAVLRAQLAAPPSEPRVGAIDAVRAWEQLAAMVSACTSCEEIIQLAAHYEPVFQASYGNWVSQQTLRQALRELRQQRVDTRTR